VKILYVGDSQKMMDAYKIHLNSLFKKANIEFRDVYFLCVSAKVTPVIVNETRAGKRVECVQNAKEYGDAMRQLIKTLKITHLIIADPAACYVVAGNYSLHLCRGSVYTFDGIPAFVVNRMMSLNLLDYGDFVMRNDFDKIGRWVHGKQKNEPAFQMQVTHSLADVTAFVKEMRSCFVAAVDCETKGQGETGFIETIQFSGLNKQGEIKTWVIPFFNPLKPGGVHWQNEEDEVKVHAAVKDILESPDIFKVFHNGVYDNSFLLMYRVATGGYFFDTQYGWHSLFCELPKSLHFISSLLVDSYQFWKEDLKGSEEDNGLQRTQQQLDTFWRYGGQDTHYTLLASISLFHILARVEYARTNYCSHTFPLNIGPALNMSVRGMRVDFARFMELKSKYERDLETRAKRVAIAVDNAEFNPRSPPQVTSLFFDVLGARLPERVKQKGSGEPLLKQVAEQHPIMKMYVDMILDYRETATMLSKYFYIKFFSGRFRYAVRMDGTETARAASGQFLWKGTNAQNVPLDARACYIADTGYLLVECDFSQSDAKFVAYQSEDERYIATMESGKDTHAVHCAFFFKLKYENIIKGLKAKDPFYSHQVTGVRQVTKRIVHGSNFMMQMFTLYGQMGRDAVVAAAQALGYHDAVKFTQKQLIKICEQLLESFHHMYPGLRPWYERVAKTGSTGDKLLRNGFGFSRRTFGKPENKATLRTWVAFYGQSGTAGNLNRAMKQVWYGHNGGPPLDDGKDLMLLLQVHDSLLLQVKEDKLHLVKKVIDIMEQPVTINGRTFHVAVDAKAGRRWGAEMKQLNFG